MPKKPKTENEESSVETTRDRPLNARNRKKAVQQFLEEDEGEAGDLETLISIANDCNPRGIGNL